MLHSQVGPRHMSMYPLSAVSHELVSDFSGKKCEKLIDICATKPCYPGVTCLPVLSSFVCGPCPRGLAGDGSSCSSK